jgi:nicotinic acid mononucleotide adenylyltransferase
MQADYLHKKYQADIRFLHNEEMDISSAGIRKKVLEGKDIAGDVPDKVKEYIVFHNLYKTMSVH